MMSDAPWQHPPRQRPPYQDSLFRAVTGQAWRPGGLEMTAHALDLLTSRKDTAFAPGARILDIGCGAGGTLELLLQRGFRAVGLDRDIPSGTHRQRVPLLCADARRLPLADGVFDALISECVLSLLPEPEATLRQWARVLRRGGTLLLADVYERNAQEIREMSDTPHASGAAGGCFGGAVPPEVTATRLHNAGFALRQWEDHSHALRALAAQLAWHGASAEALARWLGQGGTPFRESGTCFCPDGTPCCTGSAAHCRSGGARYGYALWIADKE